MHRSVEANIAAMWEELAAAGPDGAVTKEMRVFQRASRRPSFGAELELWGAARTNVPLGTALRSAGRAARKELYAVIDAVFGPEFGRRA